MVRNDARRNEKRHSNFNSRGRSAKILAVVVLAGAVGFGLLAVGLQIGPSRATPGQTKLDETTTTSGPLIYPLTGEPVTYPATAQRPAIDIKIDDDYAARPQSGINQADVVYEEVVEGGITRWLAVFQSQDASVVGPVRSVRETDAQIVAPIGGLFAYSGGIPPFIADVMKTGVVDVGASTGEPGAYYRDNSRLIPDNLYTSTITLRKNNTAPAKAPPQLFKFLTSGSPFSAPGELGIAKITLDLSGVTTVEWAWDPIAKVWDRTQGTPSVDAAGVPITATNVIVEIVPYSNTGYIDPAGNPVPDANTVGNGQAYVLSGGEIVKATWSKPSEFSVTKFIDSKGHQIALEPGKTWVELLPLSQPEPTCQAAQLQSPTTTYQLSSTC